MIKTNFELLFVSEYFCYYFNLWGLNLKTKKERRHEYIHSQADYIFNNNNNDNNKEKEMKKRGLRRRNKWKRMITF